MSITVMYHPESTSKVRGGSDEDYPVVKVGDVTIFALSVEQARNIGSAFLLDAERVEAIAEARAALVERTL